MAKPSDDDYPPEGSPVRRIKGLPPRRRQPSTPPESDDRPRATAGEMVVKGDRAAMPYDDGATIAVVAPLRTPTAVLDAYAEDAMRAIAEYEGELEGERDADRIGRLHYEIARLYETALGDLDRASMHLDRALAVLPQHLPIVVAGRRVRVRKGDHGRAIELFDRELDQCPDRTRKAALWLSKARVLEDQLGDVAQAREAYQAAARLIEAEPGIIKALEHTDRGLRDWGALSNDLAAMADAVQGDPPLRAAVMVERARLHEIHIDDPDAAVELYESALSVDLRAASSVLPVLRRLHEQQQRWLDLVRTLRREAERTSDPTTRAAALYRVGRVQAERLGNLADAVASLEASAQSVPRAVTLQALAELHACRGEEAALATTLTELVELVPDDRERLGLLMQLGQLCHERLEDDVSAIAALDAARTIAPADPTVLDLLGSLYVAREHWDELVAMYEAAAEAATETPQRALAHARAAEVLERMGRQAAAIPHYERALDLDPEPLGTMRALERLYTHALAHRKRVLLYERFIDRMDEERRVACLMEIGALHAGPLEDPEAAERTYLRVLRLRPRHLGAVQAMQRVAEAAERWDALLRAIEQEIEISEAADQRVVLWCRAGEVLELRLGRRADAIERYAKAQAIDPHHRGTLAALARLYTAEQRWGDVVRVYERQLELDAGGPSAVAVLQRMGDVYERELSNPSAAADCYRRALEVDARAPVAALGLARILDRQQRWDDLVQLREQQRELASDPNDEARLAMQAGELCENKLEDLERAAAAYALAHELRPDDRPATEALRRVRARMADWATLADELEHDASQQRDPLQAIADLSFAAEVRGERLGDLRGAVACWRGVLERDPSNLHALLGLEPLLQQLGQHDALIELYERQVSEFQDPGAQVAALHERARLCERYRPSAGEDLIEVYTSILGMRSDDLRALEALERLAMRSGKPKALAGVDARLARLAPQAELRAAYLTRRAEAMEVGGNPEALQVYREALRLDPRARGALRGLTRVADLLRDDEALADAAERSAEIATDPVAAADAWVRAGQLKAERLGDRDGAVGDFDRALARAPDHAEAAQWLIGTMRDLGRHRSLVERLIRTAEAATEPERIAALWLELAELQARELDNPGAAQSSLQRLLREQPDHAAAMLALGRLYVADRRAEEAAALLERCLGTQPDGEIAHAAHSLLAEAQERAGRADEAFSHYAAALEARPDDVVLLRRVARLQLDQGHHAAAADVAARLLELSTETAQRVEALRWVAEAQLGLGKIDEAMDTLSEAVAVQGPRSPAAKEMTDRASTPEHWDRYVEALKAYLAERAQRGRARIALFEEIAQLQHERLGDDNASLATLVRGLRESEGDPGLRLRLAQRLVHVHRPADAIPQLQVLTVEDSARGETWRLLSRCFGDLGRVREQGLALAGLAALGEARPDELEPLSGWRPASRAIRPAALVPASWVELQLGGDPQTAIANLLAAVCDGLGKLRPPDLGAWGVASRDRIPPRTDHPLRMLVDRLSAAFALEELDVYVHRHAGQGVGIENTPKPSLLLPIWLSELTESQQTFLVAQALAHIARGTYPVHFLPPQDLALTVIASIRSVVPGYGGKVAPAELLDDRARLVARGVPRRKKPMLTATAQTCATMLVPDPNVLVHWLHQTAGRLAALVADDLVGVVEVVRRTEKLGSERGADLLARSPVVADLMRVWMSEAAMVVRRRVGLLAGAG
ncbi:tetratricopeptide repeat protein [Paraliomyxa miuraensis]|uniref:tetratricopeptide repeat protein n=1 Tax=Paraliomyxa miuraensis TaxID=376150 RepID=UPI002250E0F8|nr:tetratricopeptide repeat protein [Paraliomyxa miuraensis]MCX4244327.1 tetratricopeptide repeat protein [Paraliomyxa miuraensis]